MKYRQLIRDGTKVSVLGLGAWPLGGAMGRISAVRGKLRQRTVSLYRSISYGLFFPGTI